MTVKFTTAARLLLLPVALLLGVPEAWAQCTTTLASGSFGSGVSWSASPTFTASSAGTVTLTVTGGAGGSSTMTISGTTQVVANPGSVSQAVVAGSSSTVAVQSSGVPPASGSFTVTTNAAACTTTTTTPGAPAQQAQNQSTAVQNMGGVLNGVLSAVVSQTQGFSPATPDVCPKMLINVKDMALPYFNIVEKEVIPKFLGTVDGKNWLESMCQEGKFKTPTAAFNFLVGVVAKLQTDDPGFNNLGSVQKMEKLKKALVNVASTVANSRFDTPNMARLRRLAANPALEAIRLERQEREQVEALRGRSGGGSDKDQVVELSTQLAETQDRLKLARLNAKLAAAYPSSRAPDLQSDASQMQMAGAAALRGAGPASQAAPNSMSFDTRTLADACGDTTESCTPGKPSLWNAWMEGRAMGSSDSLLQNNALGFLGFGGVGYQATPWLMTGLSVGAETFRTAYTSGAGSTTLGLSVVPYAGIRLDQNVQASAFVGFTSIAYNTTPASGVSAQFAAQRYMVGGALTGTWREGFWRFQPSLEAVYATENQNAYTDSVGTYVSGQQVYYGRIGAGPEIGYTFAGPTGEWSLEPFVLAKINLNIASDTLAVVNNAPMVVRPGTLGSGSLGGGINLTTQHGASLRFKGSYDSIGVSGLDVWSAVLRGSLAF